MRSAANGATMALVIEPDFLAYMMQSARTAPEQYNDPGTIEAMTHAAYTAGLLPDPCAGNRLPDTLPGFVEAINRGVRYLATTTDGTTDKPLNLEYGWKFNLWAYDVPGVNSLMKATDTLGWTAGRTAIANAATAVADWYVKAGILTGETGQTMDFIAMDKYGTDGGATGSGYPQTTPGYTDPAAGNYFYNADHWNNYLLFAQTLHEKLDDLPVRLWQIPLGHVNQSTYTVGGQQVSALANTDKKWEDSAVDFFFGDTFTGKSTGRDEAAAVEFFKTDTLGTVVTYDAQTITWSSQLKAAADAGIQMIMFGPGLAGSTQGGGYSSDPPLDDWFWASKVKDYYAGGGLFIERPSAVLYRADAQSATSGDSEIHFTVAFSHAVGGFSAKDVTLSGTAGTIAGATVGVETVVDGIEYDVTVTLKDSANTCEGDVIAAIAAEAVQDKDGNSNLASTGTANTVRYTPSAIGGQGKSNVAQVPGGGEPLPGVHVFLTSTIPGGFAERTATTDDDGYYRFENVPNGTYRVTVTCPNACLDTGADTTVVSAEGSEIYEADFSFGALKPACIPNRMMVASSYPVGSVHWHQVVEEALNLGNETAGLVAHVSTIDATPPAAPQYLTLSPQTASLASDAQPAETGEAADGDTACAQAIGDSTEIEQAAIVAFVASPDAFIAGADAVVTADTAHVQADGEERAIAEAAAVASIMLDVPAAEIGEVSVAGDTHEQAGGEPREVVQVMVTPIVAPPDVPIENVHDADVADAAPAPPDTQPAELTQAAVAPIGQEAIARWAAAGLDSDALNTMQHITFLVSDLDGLYLGMARAGTIWLDHNAAGRGWFVDATPRDDDEFDSSDAGGPMQAIDPNASERIDLLTAVMHELGHVVGLSDSEIGDLMGPSLEMGRRLIPDAHDAALTGL